MSREDSIGSLVLIGGVWLVILILAVLLILYMFGVKGKWASKLSCSILWLLLAMCMGAGTAGLFMMADFNF